MKNEKYLKWIRTKPCVLCGSIYSIAPHHLRDPQRKHTRRYNDLNTIPVCFDCHRSLHDNPSKEKAIEENLFNIAKDLIKEYKA